MPVFVYSIAADQYSPPEGEGFVRADTIHEAVALIGHPDVNVYPLPADAVWPGEAGEAVWRCGARCHHETLAPAPHTIRLDTKDREALMRFISLDVETANADMASICQIGVARFVDGAVVAEWKTYVNPEAYFNPVNVSIHGIDESAVVGAPAFNGLASQLSQFVGNDVVVTHTHFDRVAIYQAARRCDVPVPDWSWLDSARVARRAWVEVPSSSYRLANLCEMIGYTFRHHDALEDAKAAGYVLLQAIADTGIDLDGWLTRVRQPVNPSKSDTIRREANPDGALRGEVIVFTGALEIPRREAADMAASIGCEVASGVTKKTTLLVVGDQDVTRLAGQSKSSKHRKAESLILKGVPIRILRESDFRNLVEGAAIQ